MTNAELHAAWPEFIDCSGGWDINAQIVHSQKDGWGLYVGHSSFRTKLPQPEKAPAMTMQKRFKVPIYEDDEQAVINVWRMAGYGNERCRAALLFLRHRSPEEYENIRKYCMENA